MKNSKLGNVLLTVAKVYTVLQILATVLYAVLFAAVGIKKLVNSYKASKTINSENPIPGIEYTFKTKRGLQRFIKKVPKDRCISVQAKTAGSYIGTSEEIIGRFDSVTDEFKYCVGKEKYVVKIVED